jgi:hypothetical protein
MRGIRRPVATWCEHFCHQQAVRDVAVLHADVVDVTGVGPFAAFLQINARRTNDLGFVPAFARCSADSQCQICGRRR